MSTALAIFSSAEQAYGQGKHQECFTKYIKALKKLLSSEQVTQSGSVMMPGRPREHLALIWMNFTGFIKDPQMTWLTPEAYPEAFTLVTQFRKADSSNPYAERFRTGDAKLLLKAIQLDAIFNLGLREWEQKERAKAARYYTEGIALGESVPEFTSSGPCTDLVSWARLTLQEMRDNKDQIVLHDDIWTRIQGEVDMRRKEVLGHSYERQERDGTISKNTEAQLATNRCVECGKREVKLLQCSRCQNAWYCDGACQKENWPTHKRTCKKQ